MATLSYLNTTTFLSYQLGEEIFAVDVNQVLEVLALQNITVLPGTPDFMPGIISLRGRAVPVIDMRLKLGIENSAPTANSCIIILEIGSGTDRVVLGALTDSVHEVFEFEKGQIEAPPVFGNLNNIDYILGIGKREEQFIILLNFDKVFSTEEILFIESTGAEEWKQGSADPSTEAVS